jgi:hypothetical protein
MTLIGTASHWRKVATVVSWNPLLNINIPFWKDGP